MMNKFWAALAMGAALLNPGFAQAASCCGGGASSSLIMPKIADHMLDISLGMERYNGYWNGYGKYIEDPPGSDLKQNRLNIGYAKRLSSRLQGSISVPFVWNDNKYTGITSSTSGLGDTAISFWYETFDAVTCTYKVLSIADLKPAVYFGASLLVPTGISPYDDVENSFDVTGRGFYRLDGTVNMEKTIYPVSITLAYTYGIHFERPVNREYGDYKEPYHADLGDRKLLSLSLGYTHSLKSMDTLTVTGAYADLREDAGTIDGVTNDTTGFYKKTASLNIAHSKLDRSRILKLSWNHSFPKEGWGENFPATDILTIGVSYVYK
jgi:hypothetical protein